MADTEIIEQANPAPATAPAAPAQAQPRRGRVVAAVIAVALIAFAAVAHVTGPLIPLLVLGGLAAVFALTFLFRATSRLLPKRRSRSRPPRLSRSRRTSTAKPRRSLPPHRSSGGQRSHVLGHRGGSRARPKGLTSPRLGRRSTSRGPGTGLGSRRSPLGSRMHPASRQHRRLNPFRRGGRMHPAANSSRNRRRAQGTRLGRRSLGQRLRHPFRGSRGSTAGPRGGQRSPRRSALRSTGRAIGTGLLIPFAAPIALGRWVKRRKQNRSQSSAAGRRARSAREEASAGRRRRGGPVRAWRAWRARRKAARNPAPPPKPEPPEPPAPRPEPQARAGRAVSPPESASPEGTSRKEPAMSNHVDAAAEAIDQHIGGWQPENAVDLDQFLSALPRLFESLSGALGHVADNLGDQHPVDPAVTERLREIATTVAGMADHAGEAHATHRTAHERELERIENPRPNERLWDVTENQ